jgi:NADH-quinone oxidoreductase subunit L
MTAFYMTRLWLTVFFGKAKTEHGEHAHENGLAMTVPLGVLAVGSLAAGWTFVHPAAFSGVIDRIPHPAGGAMALVVGVALATFVLGFVLAWLFYRPGAATDRLAETSPGLYGFLERKWYFDTVYEWYVANVQQRFAQLLSFLDQILIAGIAVRGTAGFLALFGLGAKAGYTGNLHGYVYWFFIGFLLLIAVAFGVF